MSDKSVKFLGGKMTFRTAAENKMMPSGVLASWPQSLVVEVGKFKLSLGRDFLKKLNEAVQTEEIQEWLKTLPE